MRNRSDSDGVLWVASSALTVDLVLLGCICHRVLHEDHDRTTTEILGDPAMMGSTLHHPRSTIQSPCRS